jgi:hypothetical protein
VTSLFVNPNAPVFGLTGLPAGASTVTFYLTGTTTKTPVYNADGTTQANPVPADAFGRLPPIYLDETITYRVVVRNALGATLPPEIDPYSPVSGDFVEQRTTFTPGGAGGVSRPVAVKLADDMQNPRDRGAAGDSTTDDRAAFAACDALGPFRVTQGVYRIASAITFANKVTFEPGAKILVTGGAVTFNGGFDGPDELLFILTGGAIAGLSWGKRIWFDGDVATLPGLPRSTTTGDSRWQAAFDSIVDGGVLYGDPRQRTKGAVNIDMKSASYDGCGSIDFWNSTITEGLTASPSGVSTFLKNVTFKPGVDGAIPTAGTAFVVNRSQCHFENLTAQDAFQGLDVAGGVSNHYYSLNFNGCVNFGKRTRSIDNFFHGGAISALSDWVGLTGITGTFNAGDAVSISGSVGNISADYTANFPGRYRIFFNDNVPQVGMTITSSSGGSATIAAVVIGHQVGGVRSEGNVEANAWQNYDVLGGVYSLTIAGTGSSGRTGNLSYDAFDDSVYFDTSYQGAVIDGACGVTFNCWFANSRAKDKPGASATRCLRVTFGQDCRFVANSGWGLQLDSTCDMTRIHATFDGNCRNFTANANMAELFVGGGIQRLIISNIFIGFTGANTNVPPKAIRMEPGASDYVVMSAVVAGAAVDWGAGVTGTHNRRWAVTGLADL